MILKFYLNARFAECTHDDLYKSFKLNQITNAIAIAIAKQLKDEKALYTIISILSFNGYKPKIMSLITESFRVFEKLFCENKRLAILVINNLQSFIRRNIATREYSEAVVYAIESLDYISKCHISIQNNISRFLINMLSSDIFIELHRDIMWATMVSLIDKKRTKKDMDNLISILQSIDKNQDNYSHINSIGNKIIYENR